MSNADNIFPISENGMKMRSNTLSQLSHDYEDYAPPVMNPMNAKNVYGKEGYDAESSSADDKYIHKDYVHGHKKSTGVDTETKVI